MKYLLPILLLLSGSLYSQQTFAPKKGSMLASNKPATEIEPVIKPYVERFYHECQLRCVELKRHLICVKFPSYKEDSVMRLKVENPQWIGVHIRDNKGNSLVFINPTYWYYYDDITNEINVFHELLHAYFALPHIPDAVMCEKLTVTNVDYYKKNRKEELDRIFKYIKIGHYE